MPAQAFLVRSPFTLGDVELLPVCFVAGTLAVGIGGQVPLIPWLHVM
jgi:hypothetical protein